MKKRHIKRIAFGMILLAISCQTQEPLEFDREKRYIYFDTPYKEDIFGRKLKERVDSMVYSFVLDDPSVTEHLFKIPVGVAGFPGDTDQNYEVEVAKDQTTALDSDWDSNTIDNPVFKKGVMGDTLYVKVKREKNADFKHITFNILPNAYFDLVSDPVLTSIRIAYTDRLIKPDWWNTWRFQFGEVFYREVYAKWIEIYYFGADSTISSGNGIPYHWNNMPTAAVEYWTPITFMYIRVLKQYFLDNEVYPDGDTARERILLP